jgi:hypothetical protein
MTAERKKKRLDTAEICFVSTAAADTCELPNEVTRQKLNTLPWLSVIKEYQEKQKNWNAQSRTPTTTTIGRRFLRVAAQPGQVACNCSIVIYKEDIRAQSGFKWQRIRACGE